MLRLVGVRVRFDALQGTPLMYACAGGFLDIAQELLTHKADMSDVDRQVTT